MVKVGFLTIVLGVFLSSGNLIAQNQEESIKEDYDYYVYSATSKAEIEKDGVEPENFISLEQYEDAEIEEFKAILAINKSKTKANLEVIVKFKGASSFIPLLSLASNPASPGPAGVFSILSDGEWGKCMYFWWLYDVDPDTGKVDISGAGVTVEVTYTDDDKIAVDIRNEQRYRNVNLTKGTPFVRTETPPSTQD